MASIPITQNWIDFFDKWKELPELWKVKSDIFKDRNKKKNAWPKLLKVYKEIDPDANVGNLKKRVGNIRTCYRRELKKVVQSQRSAATAEEEYVPNLWYFNALDFLRDQDMQISSIDLELEDVELDQTEITASPTNQITSRWQHSSSTSWASKRPQPKVDQVLTKIVKQSEQPFVSVPTYIEKSKQQHDAYGEHVAEKLRCLPPSMVPFCQKIINDALFLAEIQSLNISSRIVTDT